MSQQSAPFTAEKPALTVLSPHLTNRAPEPDPSAAPVQADPIGRPAGTRRRLRALLLVGAGLLALAGAADYGWRYWTVGRFTVSTDDAYVRADNSTIAPKVPGYIAAVLVGDNERVKAGQILARIDDRDYAVALVQAKADLAAAQATADNKEAALAAQQSLIDAARATIAVDQANEAFAEQEDRRYAALATKGFGSVQNAQQASSRIAAARAAVTRDEAALANTIRQTDILKAELAQAHAVLARSAAALKQAELNLSYTTITASVDGVVGNRTLRVGQYVQAGTQLMAVVPVDATYVIANYKETQLTHVRPGQPVEIDVDTFPGATFSGRVDSIAPASGQEFALLPPDNATGNFTKVVQRIPVKIVLDSGRPLAGQLRPGMSVTPSIDTRTPEHRIASEAVIKG
ncbi:HlyD family secretion protein [Microvirga sp. VF16]|uniref:HlyD family secretion protein n=1 Tax=Microvirga sp. VF16 TaxID=2807101 RepID=UPI00193CA981|nr:HlyD family secretion protein [Microvirga sp. VF16]QRM33877.1 HlyD family secretion protein [Microvirga sp. VF16]